MHVSLEDGDTWLVHACTQMHLGSSYWQSACVRSKQHVLHAHLVHGRLVCVIDLHGHAWSSARRHHDRLLWGHGIFTSSWWHVAAVHVSSPIPDAWQGVQPAAQGPRNKSLVCLPPRWSHDM